MKRSSLKVTDAEVLKAMDLVMKDAAKKNPGFRIELVKLLSADLVETGVRFIQLSFEAKVDGVQGVYQATTSEGLVSESMLHNLKK